MQGSDTDSPQEKPKTTARNTVGLKLPFTIVAISLIAVEPALAQQTSQSAVCSADNLPGMIEGFFQLTTGLGIVGLAVVWQADSLIEMFTLNPDQKKGLKRHKRSAMKSAVVLVILGPLYTVAGSMMGLPLAQCVDLVPWQAIHSPLIVRPLQQRELTVLIAALCVTSLVTGIVSANPPRPGTEDNGLTENESATLWSRDADNYISQEEYRQRYGDERTSIHQLANGTDITFKRPPATAATWTRNDFTDLEAGGPDTSVHPPHASLDDGVFIEDAHATVFAVQPSTRGHLESGETLLYIAPNGTMRGFVDYRVRIPNGSSSGNSTIQWSLTDHEIEEVRLQKGGETIAKSDGSHTPAIDYQIDDDWSATLTLEAEIHVRLKKTTRTDVVNGTNVDVVYREETRNVSDSIDVEIYDLSAYPYYAEYPNGDSGVAIFQSRPWQGYTLTEEGDARVRGVWRFYTARDTSWDALVRSNRTASTEVESDAIPVFVHAYPSRIGPRAEPVRDGPEIVDTWGTDRPSPAGTIGENVNIEVVNQSYTTTYGVAVRAEAIDREALHVAGIVRGVNASIVEPTAGSERQLRRSNLTAEVLQQNQSQATVRIELRDNETGAPIILDDSSRWYPIGGTTRNGHITIAGQQVETNASGVAIVTVDDPGIYTARYHPGSWLGHNPAYVSDTATARWHPLGTIDGWFAFLFEIFWQFIPFFVMFYAGHRLLRMLGPEDLFQRDS